MSPSRAQHVLWICDVALCTYVRCSHDSKFSPHPPSAICLERRNWQAWATSRHATLQSQCRESDRAGAKSICTPLFPSCKEELCSALPMARMTLRGQGSGSDCHGHTTGTRFERSSTWGKRAYVQPGYPPNPIREFWPSPKNRWGQGNQTGPSHPLRYVCCILANASRPNQVP